MYVSKFSVALGLLGASLAGCAAIDNATDTDEAQSDQVSLAPQATAVLTIGGDEGEDVASAGRRDVCLTDPCVFTYTVGTALTITPDGHNATADCLMFSSWIGACAGQGPSCSLVITSNISVTSLWTKRPNCTQQ
jgi:hypothetical protein